MPQKVTAGKNWEVDRGLFMKAFFLIKGLNYYPVFPSTLLFPLNVASTLATGWGEQCDPPLAIVL